MEKEIKLLDYQIIASVLFIISIIISIVLTYDKKQETLHKPRLFSEEFDRYLNLFNRLLVLIILLAITWINYEEYEVGKQKRSNLKPLEHQTIASWFAVISAIIVLDVVIENWEYNPSITNLENPLS